VALLALGLEALRRQTAREFPRATAADASARRRAWAEEAWTSVSGAAGRLRDRVAAMEPGPSASAAPSAAPSPAATIPPEQVRTLARLEALERLGRLRESGVLDEQEFQAEKRALLGAP